MAVCRRQRRRAAVFVDQQRLAGGMFVEDAKAQQGRSAEISARRRGTCLTRAGQAHRRCRQGSVCRPAEGGFGAIAYQQKETLG